MGDDAFEQSGQAPSRLAGAACEFLHLGEAQLGVGEWEPSLRLRGRGHEGIRLVLVLNLHAAPLEQFQLPIERAKSDREFAQDALATARLVGQEHDESMENCAARPRVMWTAGRRRLLAGRFMRCSPLDLAGPGAGSGPRSVGDRLGGFSPKRGTPPEGKEIGSDFRDLKDFAGFFKNASWSADYQERLNGLPGTGDRGGRPRHVRLQSQANQPNGCFEPAERKGFDSDRIGLRPFRGLGGLICLQVLWESGLCRRGSPPHETGPFGRRRKIWRIAICSPPRFPGLTSTAITWTLRLIGPGSLVVTKQNDANGNPQPLNSESEINSITIAGAQPLASRLVGTVHKSATGDGKVFFQSLTELPSRSERLAGGQSMLSIVMPDFWLSNTTPVTSATTTLPSAPAITIPDGVNTLKFGGVDTTHNQFTAPSSLPGERCCLGDTRPPALRPVEHHHQSVDQQHATDHQHPVGATTPTTTTIQHAVDFNVSGRLRLFQANDIQGDATNTPPQFSNLNPNAPTSSGIGGTYVVSGTSGTAPFFQNGSLIGGLTGAIGDLRVGGNATNLTAITFDSTGGNNARIGNFSIGGETDNVMVVAPNGLRNTFFGLGMDKTELFSNVINVIAANRGAIDSTAVSGRTISRATFGGDVVNSQFLSGYAQNFTSIFDAISGVSSSALVSGTVGPPPGPLNAQTGGGMQVLVAGNITDSIFAASVQPFSSSNPANPFGTTFGSGNFGTPQDLFLPTGHITAKIEGTIDNPNAVPDIPTKAFFAKEVGVKTGPVVPPNVPQAPYPKTNVQVPGLIGRFTAKPFTKRTAMRPSPTSPHTAGHDTPISIPIPRGPLAQANAGKKAK